MFEVDYGHRPASEVSREQMDVFDCKEDGNSRLLLQNGRRVKRLETEMDRKVDRQ